MVNKEDERRIKRYDQSNSSSRGQLAQKNINSQPNERQFSPLTERNPNTSSASRKSADSRKAEKRSDSANGHGPGSDSGMKGQLGKQKGEPKKGEPPQFTVMFHTHTSLSLALTVVTNILGDIYSRGEKSAKAKEHSDVVDGAYLR